MEEITDRVVKPRRTIGQIRSLLEEFEKSQVSVSTFCLTHNLCKGTFHKWCSRYKTKKQHSGSGFAALKITSSPGQGSSTLFAEVHGIKIYQPVTAGYLKELIRS